MSAFVIPEIPSDLAERAARIPDLGSRLLQWLQVEVSSYEEGQSRYRPETLRILEQAKQKAADHPMTETEKAEARRTFAQRYESLLAGRD